LAIDRFLISQFPFGFYLVQFQIGLANAQIGNEQHAN
jgi:hypothetical protein